MNSDSDIILRSRGTPVVFAELYERHARAVHRFASVRAGTNVADDIMSETFLVAFDKRHQFDVSIPDARPWLFGIANTLLKAHRRTEARNWRALLGAGVQHHAAAELGITDLESAEQRADAHIAVGALSTSLARMKARDRETLLLYALTDLDYDGVASALGVPIGTVRSRLNRARRILQHHNPQSSLTESEPNHERNTDPARIA